MNIIERIQNSDFWKSAESKAAIFVTGILVVIAAFLVYNYYQKTDDLEEKNQQALEKITEENKQKESELSQKGEALGTQTEKTNAYIVKEGETLWSIAEKELGDPYRWTEIKDLNELSSSEVEAGQVLLIPEGKVAQVNQTQTTQKGKEETKKDTDVSNTQGEVLADTAIGGTPATYTVESGDTLWSIAEKVYGDPYEYVEILKANPSLGRLPNGNVLIHRGNVLDIPTLE